MQINSVETTFYRLTTINSRQGFGSCKHLKKTIKPQSRSLKDCELLFSVTRFEVVEIDWYFIQISYFLAKNNEVEKLSETFLAKIFS